MSFGDLKDPGMFMFLVIVLAVSYIEGVQLLLPGSSCVLNGTVTQISLWSKHYIDPKQKLF